MIRAACLVVLFIAGQVCAQTGDETGIAPEDIRSGITFQSPDTQALQADEFANPGLLWVDRGEALFTQAPRAGSPACAECHTAADLTGVAASYPAVDAATGELFNLEARINACQTRHQSVDPSTYESETLLALTAFVARQSQGLPIDVAIEGAAKPYFESGRDYFYTRRGQLNLACHHCHEQNWGRYLRGDLLSQGHTTGYPIYRLDWQTLGSSHRRLRFCDEGVRAEQLPFGDPQYIALELFLAWRASGLPVESPGVRR